MAVETIITLTIFVITILGLIRFQAHIARVFGGTLILLLVTNSVSNQQLMASIANPGLITLILLILCSYSIEKTRLLRSIASKIIVNNYATTQFRLFVVTTLFSAILNNTAVVATLLSSIRNNSVHTASKLLLPLSYAAILGGTLTMIGTSTNLIVNSFYIDVTGQSLSFFSFTSVGIIIVLVCGVVMGFCTHWLPEIKIADQNTQKYFINAKIAGDSELIGRTVEENGLRHLESLFLIEVVRKNSLISPVSPREVLQVDDTLVFSGDITKLMQLSQFSGLETFAHNRGLLNSNLDEVVVRQESRLIGKTLKEVGFRGLFDAAVVAIKRDGASISGKLGEVVINPGDFLVLATGKSYRDNTELTGNFIDVSGVEPDKSLSGWKAWLSTGGFIVTILLSALGVIRFT